MPCTYYRERQKNIYVSYNQYENMRCQDVFGYFDIVTMYLLCERDKEPDNRFGCVSSAIKWKDVNSFNVQDKNGAVDNMTAYGW